MAIHYRFFLVYQTKYKIEIGSGMLYIVKCVYLSDLVKCVDDDVSFLI